MLRFKRGSRAKPHSLDSARLTLSPLRRLPQLFVGLALYGASQALMVQANLGLGPWDALHEGLSMRLGLSFGTIVILLSVVVLLLWIPLRQRPGFGTIANTLSIGFAADATLALLPPVTALAPRIVMMVGGVVLNSVATACYIGARYGAGPRDGLTTGFVARTGMSLRLVRTVVELSVLGIGWALGGNVGVGTVLYAVSIGPIMHFLLPYVVWREPSGESGGESGTNGGRTGKVRLPRLQKQGE
jgi:uncharacterized membrane protein YczE